MPPPLDCMFLKGSCFLLIFETTSYHYLYILSTVPGTFSNSNKCLMKESLWSQGWFLFWLHLVHVEMEGPVMDSQIRFSPWQAQVWEMCQGKWLKIGLGIVAEKRGDCNWRSAWPWNTLYDAYFMGFWSLLFKDVIVLEKIQRRTLKMIKGRKNYVWR